MSEQSNYPRIELRNEAQRIVELEEQLEKAQQEKEQLQEIVEKQDNVFMRNIQLAKELEKVLQDNQKLIEVLEWYADTSNQKNQPGYRDFSKYEFDAGQRAVKVLQEVQNGTSSITLKDY